MDCIFIVMKRLIAGRAEIDDRETSVSKTCVVATPSDAIEGTGPFHPMGITDPRCNLN
jgi:hypothetical protein